MLGLNHETGIRYRHMIASRAIRFGYRAILKPIFFAQDPEVVHDRMTRAGESLGRFGCTRSIARFFFHFADPSLEQDVHGIHFANPIGLAAGFDKNAQLTEILPSVGFGFEEAGSITGEYCEGNPKPRLWRLPESKGLVVYYGLKNDGSDAISKRLRGKTFTFPVGISVAKTNDASTVEMERGIADYEKAFRSFLDIGDYFTINISCPNAFGGEPFTTPESLDALLQRIDQIKTEKSIFLKMPVDLSIAQLDELVTVADRHRVHGFVLSNLTKKRDRPEIKQQEIQGINKGGISGKPTAAASNALIAHLFKRTNGRYIIVGCGGVFSAEDAYEKIRQGATLIQLITGMIVEGPQLIGEINRGLVRLLQRDGYKNIKEAIGAAHRTI